jgi:hypothetical protein
MNCSSTGALPGAQHWASPLLWSQPEADYGPNHGQASPVQSSFDGLLHPRCLSAQGYAQGERIPRERRHEHPRSQMGSWTARDG